VALFAEPRFDHSDSSADDTDFQLLNQAGLTTEARGSLDRSAARSFAVDDLEGATP
jgi:hypothetical protein